MTTLSDDDLAALMALSDASTLDETERALRAIANRQQAQFESWIDWKGPPPESLSILSWAAARFDSAAYFALVEFAFRRHLPAMSDPSDVKPLLDRFAGSIRVAWLGKNFYCDVPDAVAKARAHEAVALALAGGPAESRLAFAALSFVFGAVDRGVLAEGWRIASSWKDSSVLEEVKDPMTGADGETL